MRVFSREELAERATLLGSHQFCQKPWEVAAPKVKDLKPREKLTTLEWSLKNRVIRKPDGTRTAWSQDLTPFLVPIMDALDDPDVLEVVVPKPSRCGGTVVAENHAFKRMDEGSGDIMWYLAGPEEVRSYADRVLEPMFEDHPMVSERIGAGKSDNNKTRKRLGGQTFELMVMSSKTTTNRQAALIVFDEPDSYHRDFRSNFLEQGRQRQRMLGNDRKIYACAHADVGWTGGIAAAWVTSSQGIFTMVCAECGGHGSPFPTRYWPDVARFRLWYQKAPEGTPVDERIRLAGETAAIQCPHCGALLDEAQRALMVAKGAYMHKGQTLDIEAGVMGVRDPNRTMGFWIHVLMSRQAPMMELARELEGAIEHRERTGKSDKLKQVLVRTFGETFEGGADLKGIDAAALKRRTDAMSVGSAPVDFAMGVAPKGVRFVVVSVDPGHRKLDILFRGFDLEKRSWLIDRRTIRQRRHLDGVMRDIDLVNVQDDWHVLDEELERLVPLQGDPTKGFPVAVMVIDSGDGNITDRAYEYARRQADKTWGAYRRVWCLKGVAGKRPHLSPRPNMLSTDSEGKRLEPVVPLHIAGVDGLKDDLFGNDGGIGYLTIEDGSPGQIYFASDFPFAAYEELFRESKVDGRYVRNGANETIDLLNYTEAARLMLEPDRKDRLWTPGSEPIWARPVSLGAEPDPITRRPIAAPSPAQPDNRERLGRLLNR